MSGTNPTQWASGVQSTLPALLLQRLEREPDAPYLDVLGYEFTAATAADAALRLSAGLRELGVAPGATPTEAAFLRDEGVTPATWDVERSDVTYEKR